MLRLFNLSRFMAAFQVHTVFVCCRDSRVDQIADHLMAVRRDADCFALAYQLANHLRAGEGLACAWRSLNRQYAACQIAA